VLDMQHREYELVCWGSNNSITSDDFYERKKNEDEQKDESVEENKDTEKSIYYFSPLEQERELLMFYTAFEKIIHSDTDYKKFVDACFVRLKSICEKIAKTEKIYKKIYEKLNESETEANIKMLFEKLKNIASSDRFDFLEPLKGIFENGKICVDDNYIPHLYYRRIIDQPVELLRVMYPDAESFDSSPIKNMFSIKKELGYQN
jgi:hypothetical protein